MITSRDPSIQWKLQILNDLPKAVNESWSGGPPTAHHNTKNIHLRSYAQ
jgi:hypothetical protein